ncbi:serine/threonine-protein kinase [Streptomyces sp. NPDC088360]|uniref:serine/threonine-protein kinase n=1 Tax=Streptomyces sp. NPDC088360 TaxID=3154515 RepID=UPI00344C0673
MTTAPHGETHPALPGTPLLPGDPIRLGGHRIVRRLGAGGMGQVYLGRSPGGRLVAVKTVHEHLAADPHFRERFRREATAARAVTGAHTAAVLDADPDSAVPWLATAFLPGLTLRQAVAAGAPFGAGVTRSLGAHLAEALAAIHAAGIVHRDLKPSNVLLTAEGPRVIDFGIARAAGDRVLTEAGSMIGTPGFMAPEQIDGAPVGPPADVFALGAVLTFAASAEHPFGSGPVAVLLYRATHEEPDLTGVPEQGGLRGLVAECLRKDPALRPSVADVLARAADPAAHLWWREEPLRSLISPGRPRATGPDTEPTGSGTEPPGAGTEPPGPGKEPTRPEPVDRAAAIAAAVRSERRGTLTRRSLLTATGAGFAGLLGYGISHSSPDEGGDDEDAGLRVEKGSRRPGKVRWTLRTDGGTIDAALLGGSTLLVHGTKPYSSTEGLVRAADTRTGARRWQSFEATVKAPTMWGVADGVLITPELTDEVRDLTTGEPWSPEGAWSPGTRWFAVAGRRLVALGNKKNSTTELTLRSRALPGGGSPWALDDGVVDWQKPAVSGSALFLAPTPSPVGGKPLCLDATTRRALWTYEGLADDDQVLTAPVTPAAGRFALLTEDSALHVVDVRDGRRLHRRDMKVSAGRGSTALGHVPGTGGRPGTGLLLAGGAGRLIGFDPMDGEIRWAFPTAGLAASWRRLPGGGHGPVTADGVLLHWADEKTLQAIDLTSGKSRWLETFGATAQLPPAVADGTVYATAGRVCRALTLRGGKVIEEWPVDGDITDLAADASGWYARIDGGSVRAVNAARAVSGAGAATAP